MLKQMLLLVAMMPILNFFHEAGHWIGGMSVGANPKMFLQRVDMGDESSFSPFQISISNWAGPTVNYSIVVASLALPQLVPVAAVMTYHRLTPNLFASYLYLRGNRNFSTDEIKQFSKEHRLWVALLFSITYLVIAAWLTSKWFTGINIPLRATIIAIFSIAWFGYLIFLDYADRIQAS